VSENSLPRRIFEPKSQEVAVGWRRLHDVEFRNLFASPNIIMVIKPRRMRREGHVMRKILMHSLLKYSTENGKAQLHQPNVTEHKQT
jgi:hypothetical protein